MCAGSRGSWCPVQSSLRHHDKVPVQTDAKALPSMHELLGQHVKLKGVRKIGEGTFGEAFKGGGVVFKIVPMEGDLLVRSSLRGPRMT